MVPALFDYSEPWSASVVDKGELFPLPSLSVDGSVCRKLSRRCMQRVTRRKHIIHDTNQAINSLNSLCGVEASTHCSAARSAAVGRIANLISECKPPASKLTPNAALTELLGENASPYAGESCSVTMTFDESLISMPDCAGGCNLANLLVGDDKLDIQDFDSRLMLNKDDLASRIACDGKARVYWDPILAEGKSDYMRF